MVPVAWIVPKFTPDSTNFAPNFQIALSTIIAPFLSGKFCSQFVILKNSPISHLFFCHN